MTTGEITAALDGAIDDWYERQRTETGVNRNVMTVGLIMCEHMETHFPLDEARWFSGSQVRLLGGSRINKILARYGELRPLASEGGRTSRGSQELARGFETSRHSLSQIGERNHHNSYIESITICTTRIGEAGAGQPAAGPRGRALTRAACERLQTSAENNWRDNGRTHPSARQPRIVDLNIERGVESATRM